MACVFGEMRTSKTGSRWGRHQNLNPDSKISLNHANLNLVNLWVVVSQEFVLSC